MNKFFIFAVSIALAAPFTFCAPTNLQREIIILLDYLNEETRNVTLSADAYPMPLGAISFTLLPAVYQQAAPILASTSLVQSILKRKEVFQDILMLDAKTVRSRYASVLPHIANFVEFKKQCEYAEKMYHLVNKKIKDKMAQTATVTPTQILDVLADEPAFNAQSAPASFRSTADARFGEISTYVLCAYAPLDLDHFHFKKVSDELILLIPRKYLKTITEEVPSKIPQLKKISPLETLLGLKVNHLADLSIKQVMQTPVRHEQLNLTAQLEQLFLTKAEAQNLTVSWHIYYAGHGLPAHKERRAIKDLKALKNHLHKKMEGQNAHAWHRRHAHYSQQLNKTEAKLKTCSAHYEKIVCSVPVAEFERFITFLEKKINTASLFYTSCYSAGKQLEKPYKGRSYSFDVINGTASDNASILEAPLLLLPPYSLQVRNQKRYIYGINKNSIDLKNRTLKMDVSLHFDTYFQNIKAERRDYRTLIALLHPYTDTQGNLISDSVANIAHLRPAHATHFKALHDTFPFVHIDSTQKKVAVTDAQILLFYSTVLPSITLDCKKRATPPLVLSALEKSTAHYCPVLDARPFTFLQCVSAFFEPHDLSSSKVFWFKELKVKITDDIPASCHKGAYGLLHNCIITRNVQTYESSTHQTNIVIYFSDEAGRGYYIPWKKQETLQAYPVSLATISDELCLLFPTLKSQVKLKPDGVSQNRTLAVETPLNPSQKGGYVATIGAAQERLVA